MRTRALLIALLVLAVQATFAADLKSLAKQAISTNSDDSKAAIGALREAGPEGLAAMLEVHKAAIRQHQVSVAFGVCTPEWTRLANAIDAVAAQRDAWASGLYWYTDFEQAKRIAAEQHKPILSLRLLGKLDEEYSCANSRFFRTALYANKDISEYLSKNFILHWKSVRPVPKITIDFGDGRKIERTITGNSIHYILASDGQLLDAIPGLYAPKTFEAYLQRGGYANQNLAAADPSVRREALVSSHEADAKTLQAAWAHDWQIARGTNAPTITVSHIDKQPSAVQAAPKAIGKGRTEVPVLAQIMPDARELAQTTDDAVWSKMAALHADDAKLDPSSVMLVSAKQDPAAAMRRTMSKAVVENPLLKIVQNFERSIAEDTVRNEYQMHRQIHEWLAQNPTVNLDTFNERVYAELFLTPSSDPWLGLAPANTYTALPSEGLVVSKK